MQRTLQYVVNHTRSRKSFMGNAPRRKCGRFGNALILIILPSLSASSMRSVALASNIWKDATTQPLSANAAILKALMLDTFEILTTSGVVLWSRTYTAISPTVINSLITNVFIEERTLRGAGIADDISAARNPPYKHDQHTLKWTTVKELGLIFVVSGRHAAQKAVLYTNSFRLYIDPFFTFRG